MLDSQYLRSLAEDMPMSTRKELLRIADRIDMIDNPPRELLLSAAIRLDHGLCIRGYDWSSGSNFLEPETDEKYKMRVDRAVSGVTSVLEEFQGRGYYSNETKERYTKMLEGVVDNG